MLQQSSILGMERMLMANAIMDYFTWRKVLEVKRLAVDGPLDCYVSILYGELMFGI